MPKSAVFIKKLQKVYVEHNNQYVKAIIGDSLINHRVPSVRQVIRFLNETGRRRLAKNLEVTYGRTREHMRLNRRVFNNRTDAYDINEFTQSFLANYNFNPGYNKSLGHLIK